MKVLNICLCGSYNDGWGYHDNYLSYYHKVIGNDVTIITTPFINNKNSAGYSFYKTGEYIDNNGIKVIRVPLKFSNKSKISFKLRIYKDIYKKIEDEHPDIIFIHGTQFLDIRKVIEYKKRHMNVKIFADNHADYINSSKNFLSKNILHKIIWKSGIKKLIPYCEKIFGVTPLRCDFLSDMYNIPKDKIDLLVMGADDDNINFNNRENIRTKIRKSLQINKDDFVIITGGKIDKEKNIDKLIEAVNSIDNNNIKLILFGSINNNIKDKIDKLINKSYIRYIGWISSEKVYDYFLAADLAVFPGTHSTLWEQACGVGIPSIFKRWNGMTHVDVGGNCIFIDDGSVEEIVESLNNVILNSDKYIYMKNIASKKAVKQFSYVEIAKKSIGLKYRD